MNDGLTSLNAEIDELIKDLQSGVFKKKCIPEIKAFLEPGVKKCVADAVDDWRGTYTPKYYTPSDGLKNMYKTTIDENAFVMSYGAEYATTMYRSPKNVFDIVFKEGYHGGYWRVPLFIWKYRSPRPTVRSTSIFKLAEDNIDNFWNNEVEPKIQEITDKILFSYKIFG